MNRRSFIKKLIAFLSIPAGISLGIYACFSVPIKIKKNYQSSHFDGEKFFHPNHQARKKKFSDFLKFARGRSKVASQWPERVKITPDTPPLRVEEKHRLRVSFVGHATVLLQTKKINLLFDPIWDHRASPVSFAGPQRVTPPGIKLENLPPIDYILISHNHYDHLSIPTLKRIFKHQKPKVILPLGNKSIIRHWIPEKVKIIEMDWHDRISLNEEIDCILQPSLHWSARGLFDRNKCLWGSYVLKPTSKNERPIYFAGDTGFGIGNNAGIHLKRIHQKFGSFRFSMIPIGAYEPRWFMKYQHINPEEAVLGSKILKSQYNLGIHLQTFKNLTYESYQDPITALEQALRTHGLSSKKFRVLKAGQVWEIPLT